MSQTLGSNDPVRPLSIGNVVSAGLRLYRSHLKQYFGLSVKAYLWILIPIYGWAKFLMISALISRLAFSELVNQPESTSTAQSQVNPKLWSFLVAAILVGLILLGATIGLYILASILAALLISLGIGIGPSPASIAVLSLIGFVIFLALVAAFIWIYSRYLVTELSLAIEENISATTAIRRSWNLTKGFVLRIQGVVLVATLVSILVTLPIQIAAQLISFRLQDSPSDPLTLLLFLLFIGLSLSSGAIVMPYWQAIKAVLYYDLLSRREGLGLQLRDR